MLAIVEFMSTSSSPNVAALAVCAEVIGYRRSSPQN